MTDSDLPANRSNPSSIAAELSALLKESLTALAGAGQADAACRLAGRACAALRSEHPEQWGRFNALLHRLSRVTGTVGDPPTAPARSYRSCGTNGKAV